MKPTIADIGEIALVDRVIDILAGGAGDAVTIGPGDDAAVLVPGATLVLTTDSQHEGTHFLGDWMTAAVLGRRAIAVNASDVGAMGALPHAFLVALALPPETPVSWVEDLARGLRSGAESYGAAVVGGDVSTVPERLSIGVTAIGAHAVGVAPVTRSAARAGQRCWVSGHPGRAAAGRRVLQKGSANAVTGAAVESCVAAFVAPQPPVRFAAAAAEAGALAALMDISDGLAIDLGRLCRASGVGVRLDAQAVLEDEVVAEVARQLAFDRERCVLGGGEDYELICAVEADAESDFTDLAAAAGIEVHCIGEFSDAEDALVWVVDGTPRALPALGWDHFS